MILLNACWRSSSEVTLVDHLNRIINVRLQGQSPIQLLSGHEVRVGRRRERLEITGTRGTIVLRDHAVAEWSLADGTPPPPECRADAAARPHGASRPDQIDCSLHRACFEAFAASLDGGAPYPVDAAAARRSVDLIARIYAGGIRKDAAAAGHLR